MVTSIKDKVGVVQGRHCRAHHLVDYLGIHCHRNGQGWWEECYPLDSAPKAKVLMQTETTHPSSFFLFFCALFFFSSVERTRAAGVEAYVQGVICIDSRAQVESSVCQTHVCLFR